MNVEATTELRKYSVLPLRDIVVFPNMIVPLFIGREKSINALENLDQEKDHILLVLQKDSDTDEPKTDELHQIGTVSKILQLMKLPDGTLKVLVEGINRVEIDSFIENQNNYFEALTNEYTDIEQQINQEELSVLSNLVIKTFDKYAKDNKRIPSEVLASIKQIKDPAKLSYSIVAHISMDIKDRQKILEYRSISKRLEKLLSSMESESNIIQMEHKIRNRIKQKVDKFQREFYLNEQMKAIQKELGETDQTSNEINELETKIKKTKLSKEAREKALSELKKLKSMSPTSSEATVVRNYLDWLLYVPWNRNIKIKKDIVQAQKILDRDHFGLQKIKERIIEYLVVQHRLNKIKGPILCLVGPPGVGKTSLGSSIAKATGRRFVRISLGGIKDEAEIRGHRRTYIGALPGKIIQGMKKAKVSNPLILLDEVDKIAHDWRGDPASALLEVLDPEQNSTFVDHYMEVEYDLSKVMFICTANNLDLPPALLDRMEIIRLSGYTEEEKIEIAKRHLIKKQKKLTGLHDEEWKLSEQGLINLIRYYTKEAGVRNLEREINKLARKIIKELLGSEDKHITITDENLSKYSGVRKFSFGSAEKENQIGTITGLAYTEAGGDVLSIEAVLSLGKGEIKLTGKLGDVMQESIQTAYSYVKSNCLELGILPEKFQKYDIHVHVPEGAIPKDGPSAGLAMVCVIVSAFSNIHINKDIALTGEVTLRGKALPIGGLKEKTMAALRANIKTVLIPKENEKNIEELSDNIKKKLNIIPVNNVREVLDIILMQKLTPITNWIDKDTTLSVNNTSKIQEEIIKTQIN